MNDSLASERLSQAQPFLRDFGVRSLQLLVRDLLHRAFHFYEVSFQMLQTLV